MTYISLPKERPLDRVRDRCQGVPKKAIGSENTMSTATTAKTYRILHGPKLAAHVPRDGDAGRRSPKLQLTLCASPAATFLVLVAAGAAEAVTSRCTVSCAVPPSVIVLTRAAKASASMALDALLASTA